MRYPTSFMPAFLEHYGVLIWRTFLFPRMEWGGMIRERENQMDHGSLRKGIDPTINFGKEFWFGEWKDEKDKRKQSS